MANVEIKVHAVDKASSVLGGIFGAMKNGASAAAVAMGVLNASVDFVKDSVKEFADYSEQVRDLGRIAGTSAEETSRLIQVADDVRISFGTLTTAARFAAKNGIEMTVESLAKLSDEYNNLAPGAERAAFLIERFGRGGLEMGKLLEKGSGAIRNMNAGISENLVLTEANLKAQDEYVKSIDEMNDAWLGIKLSIGKEVVPVMNEMLQTINDNITYADRYTAAAKQIGIGVRSNGTAFSQQADALVKEQMALNQSTENWVNYGLAWERALNGKSSAIDDSVMSVEDQTAATNELLGVIQTMQSEYDGYIAQNETINQQIADQTAHIQELTSQGYSPLGTTLQTEQEKLNDLNGALAANAAAHEEASRRNIFAMIQQGAAADGWQEGEFEALLALGEGWGIYSAEVVDEATSAYEAVQKMEDQPELLKEIAAGMMTLNKMPDGEWTFTTNYVGGSPPTSPTGTQGYAEGGMGWVNEPTPMVVGEGGEPEFVMAIPKSKMSQMQKRLAPLTTGNSIPVSTGGAGATNNYYYGTFELKTTESGADLTTVRG